MHLNFNWTAVQVLWTLTFAALLVLLVVLLGRERYKQFKWFTIGIVLVTFRLLASRLLYGKMAPISLNEIFIPMADLSAIVSLLVLVELARKGFVGLGRRAWIIGTFAITAVGAGVLAVWGPWPAWKTATAGSTLATLELMELVAQKCELLVNVLTVELGLLMLAFGRRYKGGWRSHTQGILIGLSTVAIAQMLRDGVWELIALKAAPHTRAEYDRVVGLGERLFNANEVVYLVVLVWWIAYLWIDEPRPVQAKIETVVPVADGALEISEETEHPELR